MRTFAEAWPDFLEISQDILANLPWGHNLALISKVPEREKRVWYAHKSVENGWSRNLLVNAIESQLYEQSSGAISNNFERTLPQPQSDLARDLIKDPYYLDFLYIEEGFEEKDTKRLIVAHMREFLLTLGIGFSFVGHNYRIEVAEKEYFLDMLFYHLRLRCFVVIEMAFGEFQPEQSGRMNFYVSAVDAQEKQEHDQPTIGIILCSSKNNVVVEYSLQNLSNPIAVAQHRIPKMLPSKERLQQEMERAIQRFGQT